MITINADFIIFLINFIMFLVFGFDKMMAKRKGKRVSEAFLLVGALCFGAFGSLLGMVVFNHKTSKMKFRLLIPFFLLLNCIVAGNDFFF